MRLACRFLLAVLLATNAFAQSRLSIDKLDDKDIIKAVKEVAFSTMLEGTVDDPKLAVYVLVHSPGGAWRSFPAVVEGTRVDPAGGYRWRAICQFGDYDGRGVGVSYQVRVAAFTPKHIKRNGNLMESVSRGSLQSNAITIKRVKK